MKKLFMLTAVALLVIGTFFTHSIEGISIRSAFATDPDAGKAPPVVPGSAADLQIKKDAATTQRDLNEKNREKAATTLDSANAALKAAQASNQDTTKQEADVKTAQAALQTAQTSLQSANDNVTAIDDKLQATPEKKVERIQKNYADLIKATEDKGTEIDAAKCTGLQQEIDACTTINKQKKTANDLYKSFLVAKMRVEMCQVSTSTCPEGLQTLQAQQNAFAGGLNAVLKQLTQAETQSNQAMTFNVSGIFNPDQSRTPTKSTLLQFTNTIATWMITLVSSLAVTALVIGGFMMIISGGDENRLEMGKTIFTYSLIGLAVTLMAYGIIASIQALFY